MLTMYVFICSASMPNIPLTLAPLTRAYGIVIGTYCSLQHHQRSVAAQGQLVDRSSFSFVRIDKGLAGIETSFKR